MSIESTLKKFSESESISGFERNIREIMMKEMKPYVDEIRVDDIGNLIARKGKGSPKIMIAAHMDQLGLIVKNVTKEGFINFDTVGGWDERVLPTCKVRINGSKGTVIGIVGSKPPHLQEKEEMKLPYKKKELFIDIGASSDKEVEKAGVSVGDFITRHSEFNNMVGSRVTGPGLDNRAGCTIIVEALKRLKSFKGTVYFVGTIQEEIGLIGIRGAAFGIDPDVAVAVDTTIGGDTPGITDAESAIKLGKGPVLGLKDAVSFTNPRVKRWLIDTAKASKINIQLEVISGGASDASIIPTVRDGIPSGTLQVATRYIHTAVEVLDMKDMESCVKLLIDAIKSCHKHFK
jgi:putative aminopeptidase FrvX